MRIAFLGIGTMGAPMARNLARAGYSLTLWNRRRARAESLGLPVAETPAVAVEAAELVITMLSDAEALEAVLFGPGGAATIDVTGKLFVDMSTVGPRVARSVAERLGARGGRFVDAPVSGSRAPAERAELVVLAGGSEADVRRLAPVFSAIAKRVIHAGEVGAGQTLKVVLNGLGCQHLLAFASMLRLGERAGLARDTLVEAFTEGAFATPAYKGKRERVLDHRYGDPDFVLELVLRDAELCAELQRDTGAVLPTHRAAHEEVRRAVERGWGKLDLFVVEDLYS
jgi:3-hydroxyisobutyrate dehydrogenase-like beta-hydroxyacid dehydrogenase